VPGDVIRILSDLHYGDRASLVSRLGQLRPLFDGIGRLVLNGDTLDTRPGPHPGHAVACRDEVLDFFPRSVPAVTYLTGNHDADLSPHHRLDLARGQVFVTHGDIVFDNIVPWSNDAALIGQRIAEHLAAAPAGERDDLDRRLFIWRQVAASIPQRHQSERHGFKHFVRYLADTAWPPARILRVLQAWREQPRLAAALARRHRPAARYVVTGHIHRPGIWHDPNGLIVINTGSYTPPLGGTCVDLTLGRLVVRALRRRRGEFHPGRVLAEFPLADS
jgi:predicted phosphodiesterase